MKLRHIEKLKKEAKLYKNIFPEIKSYDGKQVDLALENEAIAEVITKLVERRRMLEALTDDSFDTKEKQHLYESLEKNNQYFLELSADRRKQIETYFETADDNIARTAGWQNFFMAFTFTENLSSYHSVDKCVDAMTNPTEKTSETDVAKNEINKKQIVKAMKPYMDEMRTMAGKLMEKNRLFLDSHKNSKEFNHMMEALQIVRDWGTSNDIRKKMINPPETIEQALERLKASTEQYRQKKEQQWRPFPSKRRHMRMQLVDTIEAFAELQEENLKDFAKGYKEVKSKNQFVASQENKPVMNEQNKEVKQVEKQKEESVLELEEMDFNLR